MATQNLTGAEQISGPCLRVSRGRTGTRPSAIGSSNCARASYVFPQVTVDSGLLAVPGATNSVIFTTSVEVGRPEDGWSVEWGIALSPG